MRDATTLAAQAAVLIAAAKSPSVAWIEGVIIVVLKIAAGHKEVVDGDS